MKFFNDERTRTSRRTLRGGTLVASALALALAGCASTSDEASAKSQSVQEPELRDRLPQEVKDRGVLRIGTVTSTNPFTQKPGEEVIGLIPDLAHEVAGRLGLELEFHEAPMAAQVAALQSDRVDITWSAMSDTVEREETINMIPYIANQTTPLVQYGNPQNIHVIEDLCGKVVATVRGGDNHLALEDLNKKACTSGGREVMDIKLYDKSSEAMLQVQSGKADAFVGIGLQMRHIAETANGGKTFGFIDAALIESTLTIGVAKDEMELADLVSDTLSSVVESGRYEEILAEYKGTKYALTPDQIVVNPLTSTQ